MYHPISIPADCKMLYNVVKLKSGVSIDDVDLLLGTMCNIVKENYGDDNGGFIAGQVFQSAGFVSSEGSINAKEGHDDEHVAIITYWKSFEQHEASHADEAFADLFNKLAEYCESTYEIGYNLLWQGEA